MNHELLKRIQNIFVSKPAIKLVYLFGSRATEKTGPLSDFDFAFYIDEKDVKKLFEIKLILIDELSRALKTDRVDVVILNLTESPELKYNIIKDGELIFKREPFQVLIEPKILTEYFDFHYLLTKYNLTRSEVHR
jgi:predicted nucleotidyltransferase